MPLALGLSLTAAVLSGAAALVYEVVWLRMLGLSDRTRRRRAHRVRVKSAGPAIYARTFLADMRQRSFREQVASERVVFYQDGKSGSVAVTEVGQHRILSVNGKVDASTFNDMPTQLTVAHLPSSCIGPPRGVRARSGERVTAAAALAHPVERVDVVELEPAVVEASQFFASAQGRSLHPRPVGGDARHPR